MKCRKESSNFQRLTNGTGWFGKGGIKVSPYKNAKGMLSYYLSAGMINR